jgi:phytoene dehydrogenase-like protein
MSLLEKTRTGLRYLPMMPVILKWKNVPITRYLARYRNPFLREVLLALTGDERMSTLVLVMVLGLKSRKNTAFVAGGSWAFAKAIADRYTALGGTLRYNAEVVSVSTEHGRATGVRCADGTAVPASAVVSCADGHTTIFKMLEGRFVSNRLLRLYQKGELFPALIQVSLGINRTFPDAPHAVNVQLPQPIVVDEKQGPVRMEIETFGSNSALCPEGKTMITVRLSSNLEFWRNLKKTNPERYRAEKKRILQEVIHVVDRRFPGVASHLEYSDLATPTTFVRYTGNWQGSYEGWLPTPRTLGRPIPYTLPGLDGFYMAGHWVVAGGGLPSAALSGRYVAQMICARFDRTFAATQP